MSRRPVAALFRVSKRLGDVQALDSLDLALAEGEFVALLGPNGAGKTTALNLLLGLRRPDSGSASLFGSDPRDPRSRRDVGVVLQHLGVPAQLRVYEVTDLVRSYFANPLPAQELLQKFNLSGVARRQVGGLSGGQHRLLAVALAFTGRPRVLFLDEPTTGLDVNVRRNLWSIFAGFVAEGGTILLTTHYLEEAEALASRVVVINKGRLVVDGSADSIKRKVGLRRVSFRAPAPPVFKSGAVAVREGDRYVVTVADSDETVREIARAEFTDLVVQTISLEEAFRCLVPDPH
ncbi:MAG: ABC transporter ATP-binding protein [Chloroflexi bacterium]|nr:ABC transporter ATP-binding protein [Chloroflexota bacterium]